MKLTAPLRRKDSSLPVFVVIPGKLVKPWDLAGTTVIEGTANGHDFGRRTIKPWGKGVDAWFIEFTAPFCKTAGLNVGDKVVLDLRLADTSTPNELDRLLSKNQRLNAMWLALSDRERRDASEHVRSAKGEATRARRAKAVVEKLGGHVKT